MYVVYAALHHMLIVKHSIENIFKSSAYLPSIASELKNKKKWILVNFASNFESLNRWKSKEHFACEIARIHKVVFFKT